MIEPALEKPVIELRDVTFAYDGTPVVEGATFQVRALESICVVGPNGGGKTTLVKLILGLLRPDAGTVRVFDQSPESARLRIGYMPQHAQYDAQFPVTVQDVVLMGRLGQRGARGLFGWRAPDDRQLAMESLAEVGMETFAARPFSALSGGQRQRVLIARALCCQPELLVLDEPTSNVDTLAEAKLLEILQRLSRRMTIVMVSHDLGFVSSLVERVICVNRQVAVHPTSEVSGETIDQMYGGPVRVVHHDQHCHEHGGDDDA